MKKANEAVRSTSAGPARKIKPLIEILATKKLNMLCHFLCRERQHPLHQLFSKIVQCHRYPVPVVLDGQDNAGPLRIWHMHGISSKSKTNTKFRYQLNRNNQHIRNQLKEPVCACAYRTPSALTSWTQNETIFVRTNLSVKKCNPLWNKMSVWMFTSFNST